MNGVTAQPVGSRAAAPLATRTLSAVVLAPPVLAMVYLGTPLFEILVATVAAIMAWEWQRLCAAGCADRSRSHYALWLVVGALWIGVPCLIMIGLRADPAVGRVTVLWLLAVVWAADIGAYAAGRTIGGPRLAPAVSPNKTWAGFFGGVACAAAAGAGMAGVLGREVLVPLAAFSAFVGMVAQGGDLAESWVKRRFGVKDSGSIIPGHGGLLDRMDGVLAAVIAVGVAGYLGKGTVLTWL